MFIPWRLRLLLHRNPRLQSAVLNQLKKRLSPRLIARVKRLRVVHSLYHRSVIPSWSPCRECPRALYDAAGAKVGNRLYIIRGYEELSAVNNKIFVFDLDREQWVDAIDPPARVAHSHMAVCSDGVRFIYMVSGQLGPQCHPAIPDSFAFDTINGIWRELPALPAPRYGGTMQILGHRLHFVGGALPDRYTPASDHWSLGVQEGQALDARWREEPPVPTPAMHRGSATIGKSLYVFGGQQGDFVAIDGDPSYTCTGKTREIYLADSYRFDSENGCWTRLHDMPVPASHSDFSVIVAGNSVQVVGGQIYKHPDHFGLRLTDLIQTYDVIADRWSIGGYLPYRLKLPICTVHREHLYCITGQRDSGSACDAPGRITADTWRTPLLSLGEKTPQEDADTLLPRLNGKDVVLISHELTWTGASLILLETARAMRESGANVRLFTLADDAFYGNPAERYRIPVLPIETAMKWAAAADLVVANTMVAGPWIRDFLAKYPSRAGRLIWWNHENCVEEYRPLLEDAEAVPTMLFDSHASLTAWETTGLPLPAKRIVLYPGNRSELRQAAETERLLCPAWGSKRLGRDAGRRRLGVRKSDFLILCVGTVTPRKGQMLLLRTVGGLLAQHPNLPIRLLLVGFADELHRHETLSGLPPMERAAVLNGRLLWAQQQDISIFYRSADAFVMNSQGNGENFGRVTIEAMAYGLPILGTDAGGTREIVVDGTTGLLHPVGEGGLEVLRANILRLVSDRKLGRQLGLAGQQRASECFSSGRFFRELEDVLAPALSKSEEQCPNSRVKRSSH